MKNQQVKKYFMLMAIFGAVSVSAEESKLNISSSQEQRQEREMTELEKQEALALQAELESKRAQTAEWREHQKILNYIDRHDRN